jgi:hypothetical protein
MLVEAQLGEYPFYRLTETNVHAAKASQDDGYLSTWGMGRTRPSVRMWQFALGRAC